jgi:Kef-type K+ transport system membrane component KefB
VTSASVGSLVLIGLAAVLAPVLSELSGRLAIPEIVFQIGLGMLLGPFALDLVHVSSLISELSDLGLTFLMFLAGYELDLQRIRGAPLKLATLGWLISLVIGLGAAFALVSTGLARDTLVVGLAVTTTALGTLVPILRDAGMMESRFGALVSGVGTVGEFLPIVAVALLLTKKEPLVTSLLLIAFIVVAVATVLVAARKQPPRLVSLLNRHLESSAQLPVRVSLLFILLLVLLASILGLDVLLGAFAAGIVVRLFTARGESVAIRAKLEAIGFGFLIPIFFVVSGVRFDAHVFIEHPLSLWRVPMFLLVMLVARGVPVYLLYRAELPAAQRTPMALLSATGLPLIVVITSIAIAEHRILEVNAASLVAAGMLSVLLFPALALWRLRSAGLAGTASDAASGATADLASDTATDTASHGAPDAEPFEPRGADPSEAEDA